MTVPSSLLVCSQNCLLSVKYFKASVAMSLTLPSVSSGFFSLQFCFLRKFSKKRTSSFIFPIERDAVRRCLLFMFLRSNTINSKDYHEISLSASLLKFSCFSWSPYSLPGQHRPYSQFWIYFLAFFSSWFR